MVGHVVLVEEKGRRPWLERAAVLGAPLLRAHIPVQPGTRERSARRRVGHGAWLLADSGVRRVLTAPDAPWWDILKEEGLVGVDTTGLLEAMAAPLVLAELELRRVPLRSAAVALRGTRVNRAMFQAAEALCPRVRALMISGAGGEELRAHPRREYGAAVLEDGAGARPDAVAVFPPAPEPENMEIKSKVDVIPVGFDPLPLLAFLWEEGQLPLDQLAVIPKKLT